MSIKTFIAAIPVLGPTAKFLYKKTNPFRSSSSYWETRYSRGGNSGAGSYNRLAEFKAQVLNSFVEEHAIKAVIEWGSGDGAQLRLAKYPSYIGVDVSKTAIASCKEQYKSDGAKKFYLSSDVPADTAADLSLSLDVIYHLVEDEVFDAYMRTLFKSGRRYAIIYSSNEDKIWPADHVRHRKFTDWIEKNMKGWELVRHLPNKYPYNPSDEVGTSFADFYMFKRL